MIKNQIENFEEAIINKSFYSIGKCLEMKKLATTHKQFCTFVENRSKLNSSEIKKMDIDTKKQEEKLSKRAENFIKAVS